MGDVELRERAAATVRDIQTEICGGLEALERRWGGTASFSDETWSRPGGGGGRTRVTTNGRVLEKGGVNVSLVHGRLEEAFARELPGDGCDFHATGVSLVLHPVSPHVPTVHANFRYIEQGGRAWFGGGADLTPYYHDPDDERHFHAVWQAVCEAHRDVADHARFRDDCDRYFWLPHRGERRGVGGIFFDYLHVDRDRPDHGERLLAFVRDGGMRFLSAWLPIAERHLGEAVTDEQRRWQELRRGRYAEFNLLYDRGTIFGLRTGGRTESILMSLPPRVRWEPTREPAAGTPEAALLDRVRRPPPAGPAPGAR